MMGTSVLVCSDPEAIASRALDLLVSHLRSAIGRRGVAHLALTGGSSANALFRLLRDDERARRVDWTRVHVWQGDERFVPWSDPESNWSVARREWLDHMAVHGIPEERLHPMPVDEAIARGEDIESVAERYAEEIERTLPQRAGVPMFDVVLLGVGSDAHILSTFPGTAAIGEMERAVLAVDAPEHIEPRVPRVTLAPHLLRGAGLVIVMVPGAAKAGAIAECFGAIRDPERWPAQLALRPNAVWLLEPGSASEL